jgi:hypothetical protein
MRACRTAPLLGVARHRVMSHVVEVRTHGTQPSPTRPPACAPRRKITHAAARQNKQTTRRKSLGPTRTPPNREAPLACFATSGRQSFGSSCLRQSMPAAYHGYEAEVREASSRSVARQAPWRSRCSLGRPVCQPGRAGIPRGRSRGAARSTARSSIRPRGSPTRSPPAETARTRTLPTPVPMRPGYQCTIRWS